MPIQIHLCRIRKQGLLCVKISEKCSDWQVHISRRNSWAGCGGEEESLKQRGSYYQKKKRRCAGQMKITEVQLHFLPIHTHTHAHAHACAPTDTPIIIQLSHMHSCLHTENHSLLLKRKQPKLYPISAFRHKIITWRWHGLFFIGSRNVSSWSCPFS